MFVGKGKGENKILKELLWTIIFKILFHKYLVVRRTTRSQFLVVLTHFFVLEDTRTRECCYPECVHVFSTPPGINLKTGPEGTETKPKDTFMHFSRKIDISDVDLH